MIMFHIIFSSIGGGRKLQLQQVIPTSGESSSLPVKLPLSSSPANQKVEVEGEIFFCKKMVFVVNLNLALSSINTIKIIYF
jgi:hypothetical protein